LAHAATDSEHALPVARAALAAVASIPRDQQVLYFHILRSAVGQAARKAFEMLPHRLDKYLTEEERQQRATLCQQAQAEGRAEGLTSALVTVLETRGITLSDELRSRLADKSAAELSDLLRRSLTATSGEELLG
jgi:hypothetical protein